MQEITHCMKAVVRPASGREDVAGMAYRFKKESEEGVGVSFYSRLIRTLPARVNEAMARL